MTTPAEGFAQIAIIYAAVMEARELAFPDVALFEWDMGDRIHKAMRVRDVGVQELADWLHVSRNTIGNWVAGRATPRGQSLIDLASALDVPVEWLRDDWKDTP